MINGNERNLFVTLFQLKTKIARGISKLYKKKDKKIELVGKQEN